MASVADEKRRVMVAYLVGQGIANAASMSLSDLEYHYWYKQNGNAFPLNSNKSLNEHRRQKHGATPSIPSATAARTFLSATNSESLPDATKRYWTAL